jgi:methylated-DNA-[protein]-cysteine S-methyltransferase
MLDHPLKLYHDPEGPSISVHLYADNGQINRAVLYPHHEMGIQWQLFANYPHPELETQLEAWFKAYIAKKQMPRQDLPLNWTELSPFTTKVLKAIREIGFGEVLTYGELAAKITQPRASRPVGSACGRNPFPLIIPCHRVLAAGYRLGGYSLDPIIKRRLLSFEGISLNLF